MSHRAPTDITSHRSSYIGRAQLARLQVEVHPHTEALHCQCTELEAQKLYLPHTVSLADQSGEQYRTPPQQHYVQWRKLRLGPATPLMYNTARCPS